MESRIAKQILRAKKSGKKIKIVLGDIQRITDVVHPLYVFGKDKALTESEHDALWLKYEKVRFITNNECPSLSYFFIFKLCEYGLVESIITTNYDQYIESSQSLC